VLRGIHVAIFDQAAEKADMRSHAHALLHVLPAAVALLRREAPGDSYDSMTSAFQPALRGFQERAPTRVVNALVQVMVAHHPRDVHVFDTDAAIVLRVAVGDPEMMVTTLARDLEVFAGDFTRGLPAALTARLAAAQRTLRVCEALLARALVARILHQAAVRV